MKVKSTLKLGETTYLFETDEMDDKEALHKSIVLANPPKLCTNCNTEGYDTKKLTTNKDKEGNIYVNIKCQCGAKAKLGQYKAGGFFWHREFEIYTSGKQK